MSSQETEGDIMPHIEPSHNDALGNHGRGRLFDDLVAKYGLAEAQRMAHAGRSQTAKRKPATYRFH